MKTTIGLDIGGSTTKIIGFSGSEILKHAFIKASDPMAAAYGAIGRFLNDNSLSLADVDCFRITGVGASYLPERIFEKKTLRIPEFEALGIGGLYAAKFEDAIVVSMGTGTSIVRCTKKGEEHYSKHIIGSGVGGGTVTGLARKMLNISEINLLSELSTKGDLDLIDLTVGDISKTPIPGLSSDTTAANFGKVKDEAGVEDLALGIVNMVFQSVGTAAVLSARLEKCKDIVFIGTLAEFPMGQKTLDGFSKLYGVNVVVPEEPGFCTAIGAALSKA